MLVDEVVQGDKVELELVEDCILGEVDISGEAYSVVVKLQSKQI